MNDTASAQAAAPKTVTEQLDALFAPWNRTDAPGLTVGVAREGRLVYRRGFGMASLETCVANSPKTRMRIGSTSKHFTALLALLLAEDGKFDLDAPIRTWIPELTGPGGDPSPRLLMQHRGGSRCYLDLAFVGHGIALTPVGTALKTQTRQAGRNFAPGEAMIYNNGGYHLVSIALERAGGAPFESQLRERLFEPVGMPDTASIPTDHVVTPGIATMHVPTLDGRWRRGLFPSDEVRGEGAIVSTVDDMLRWAAHLRSRGRFGTPATWAALTELPTYADGRTGAYALGLMRGDYRGLATVHHAGGVFGGSSQMLTVPDHGLDIVILANGALGANPVRLAEQVVDIVLADRVSAPAATIPAKDYAALIGDWWSRETGLIYGLTEQDGALGLQICSKAMPGMPLTRPAGGRAVLPASGIGEIALDLDGATAEGMEIAFGGRSARYRRVAEDGKIVPAFAEAVSGRYYSPDADATATIAMEGDGLAVHFADPFGGASYALTCLGETVASTKPKPMEIWGWSALTFEDGGFRLNTARTRNLRFDRV
ncbi:MAG: serine hydrolase domain-containing protein [Caulobacteraceae bacterium]